MQASSARAQRRSRPLLGRHDVSPLRIPAWRGVGEPWLLSALGELDPETFVQAQSAETLVLHSVKEVHRLEPIAGRRLYAKILRAARKSRHTALIQRIKWACPPSRALQVWRVSARFERDGLHCAKVVLAARGGSLLTPVDVLITERVEGRSLRQILIEDPLDDTLHACRLVGESMARLHQANILHGDAVHSNVVLQSSDAPDASARIVWIDNDRTRAWPILPAPIARRNLQQMANQLRHWGRRPLRAMIDGYADAMSLSQSQRQRLNRYLARRLRARRSRAARRGEPLTREVARQSRRKHARSTR